jgi:hypothetical protein
MPLPAVNRSLLASPLDPGYFAVLNIRDNLLSLLGFHGLFGNALVLLALDDGSVADSVFLIRIMDPHRQPLAIESAELPITSTSNAAENLRTIGALTPELCAVPHRPALGIPPGETLLDQRYEDGPSWYQALDWMARPPARRRLP